MNTTPTFWFKEWAFEEDASSWGMNCQMGNFELGLSKGPLKATTLGLSGVSLCVFVWYLCLVSGVSLSVCVVWWVLKTRMGKLCQWQISHLVNWEETVEKLKKLLIERLVLSALVSAASKGHSHKCNQCDNVFKSNQINQIWRFTKVKHTRSLSARVIIIAIWVQFWTSLYKHSEMCYSVQN